MCSQCRRAKTTLTITRASLVSSAFVLRQHRCTLAQVLQALTDCANKFKLPLLSLHFNLP
uniref:Uncharacterized protein n=1 Tax=Anguilla anguilla TaxID=7936 RepID=A0A0E9TNE3_ANGAN